MKKPLISVEKCKGCGLCIGACPKKILEMSSAFNKQGVNYPKCKDEPSCIGCKFCAMIWEGKMGERVLLKGNEAASEAALIAGCTHYFAYPITPQNEISAYMAKRMPKLNRTFLQAESEIAACNMVYGAAATGARAMTSSSSPGIALKQESFGYIAGAEVPAVVINMMRGGPGLGNISGSQGDFQELADLTLKAFDVAEKYRILTLILGDGYLAQMSEPCVLPEPSGFKAEKPWALTGAEGRPAQVINSLRLADGVLEVHNRHLEEKYKAIEAAEVMFENFHCDDADFVLVAYGTASRVCKAAVMNLRKQGIKAGVFRPITLWPFPSVALAAAVAGKKQVLTVEMSLGQMVADVRLAVNGAVPVDFLGRPGGAVPMVDEVTERVLSYGR